LKVDEEGVWKAIKILEENMVVALMLARKEDGGHGGVLLEKKVESFLFLKEEGGIVGE
jgi:hypothetical protein